MTVEAARNARKMRNARKELRTLDSGMGRSGEPWIVVHI